MTIPTEFAFALFLFALGRFLDFGIRRWSEHIWLYMRVVVWERLDRLQPRSLHRALLNRVVRWFDVEEDEVPKGAAESYLAFVCLFGILASNFALLLERLPPKFNASTDSLLGIIASRNAWLAMGGISLFGILFFHGLTRFAPRLDKVLNRIKASKRRWIQLLGKGLTKLVVSTILAGGLACFAFPIAWLYLVWDNPPHRVAGLTVLLNSLADMVSFGVTVRLLQVSSRGGDLRLFGCALLDLVAAAFIAFLAYMLTVLLHSSNIAFEPRSGLNSYLVLLMLTNFLPTVAIYFGLLALYLLKISQLLVRELMRYFVDQSAHPTREAEVFPFTTLGFFGALVLSGVTLLRAL